MKKTIIASAFLSAVIALPVAAHHPSPAEPEIGDMMDMHETTVDALIEDGVIQSDSDMAVDEIGADSIQNGLDAVDTGN